MTDDWCHVLGDHRPADAARGFRGTSFAAPVVAGHAALILTDEGGGAAQVKQRMLDVSSSVEVRASCVGSGLVHGPLLEPYVDLAGHL